MVESLNFDGCDDFVELPEGAMLEGDFTLFFTTDRMLTPEEIQRMYEKQKGEFEEKE